MQLKVFVVPLKNIEIAECEMNAFLRGQRVLTVKKEFVSDGDNSFWTFCVEYLNAAPLANSPSQGKSPRVDYRELLKPEEFEVCRGCVGAARVQPCSCIGKALHGQRLKAKTYYPQMTQIFTDEGEGGEGQDSVSWPRLHLCKSCRPSVDDNSLTGCQRRRHFATDGDENQNRTLLLI